MAEVSDIEKRKTVITVHSLYRAGKLQKMCGGNFNQFTMLRPWAHFAKDARRFFHWSCLEECFMIGPLLEMGIR